jgi:arginyl-tRNA synthetase
MKKTLEERLRNALKAMGAPHDMEIEIEVPREESFGDLSTPVAMGLARSLRKKPGDIASEIVGNLKAGDEEGERIFGKVEKAGPGFINVTFRREFLYSMLRPLVAGEVEREDIGKGRRVQVEFVSANPTGPLHLGHGRGAAVGSALSNLLESAGYVVTREYYVNDAGRQVRLLAESVFARYKELQGVEYEFPGEGYRGGYVTEMAREMIREAGDRYRDSDFAGAEGPFTGYSLKRTLDEIKGDLERFGVTFDAWQSERELYESGAVEHAVDFLRRKGFLYESEGALWFRATEFGDEKDRVVIKSDGEPTYFASDIAYHLKKVEAGYDEIINVWGADHHGYVPRLEAVMDALGCGRKRLRVLLVQMVSLSRAGKPVQMSKRAGEFVTLDEVTGEVGADTTKFIFLTRRHDSHLSFDLDVAREASAENPVYYVQYANARINSIFRHAKQGGLDSSGLRDAELGRLEEDEEVRIVKKLLAYPMSLSAAAASREPHRLTFYLQELAGMFHQFYNRHRVVTGDAALSTARLALCEAVRVVLRDGLGVLGLTAPERM